MSEHGVVLTRPVFLAREGSVFRLAFERRDLNNRARELPYAEYHSETRTWTTLVCGQSVDQLRRWFYDGLTDISVDALLAEGEDPEPCAPASLRPGSTRRPFLVGLAMRNDLIYSRLKAVPGAQWEAKARGISYPAQAATALAELVDRGVIDDPGRLLTPADVVIAFDGRVGKFVCRAVSDELARMAQVAFDKYFPARDVVQSWMDKRAEGKLAFSVAFESDFAEEIYRGEIARVGPGLQPEGLLFDLFPYQRQNVAVAVERSGIGIFDMPGLGKSPTAIAAALEMMNRGLATRVVVVVPGAIRTQFAREITRFTGHEDVAIVDGSKKKRFDAYEQAATSRWLIVHYDVLHLDYKALSPLVSGSILIADEAHRLKNPTSKRTKAMRELARRATRRIALSGTPVENLPSEFYNVLSGFAIPGCLGSSQEFLARYMYPGRFGGWEGARNLKELRQRSQVFYVRHTKAEVATHLPPLRVKHVALDPDPAYAAALRRAHREAGAEIKEAALERAKNSKRANGVLDGEMMDDVATGAEMTAVGMLRLMCTSPRLVAESDSAAAEVLRAAGIIPDEDGPKLDELRTMAAEMQAAGERLVAFTFSKRMANLIADRFREDGIRFVLFTGDSSSNERDAAVTAFTTEATEDNPGPTVFVATDAAAEGLNLGRCCSTLVNVDIPWTPGRAIQRANRIHRIDGTAPSYLVINLTCRGTIEEGILRMVEHKADLSDAIFGESGGRRATTGRAGRSIFEQAMEDWSSGQGSRAA